MLTFQRMLFLSAGIFGGLVSAKKTSAKGLINNAIDALGGRDALKGLSGVAYEYPDIFRVNSLNQNFALFTSDRWLVSKGAQNISFSFEDGEDVRQRIDRYWQRSDYFYFLGPSLPAGAFSLVVRGGDDGYSCYVEGNNYVFEPPDETSGYNDAALTEYLVLRAKKLSPTLLLEIEKHHPKKTIVEVGEARYSAVKDDVLDLVVAFDEDSLPYIIRSFEKHSIFGDSTNDLILTNYTETGGVMFPHRQVVTYNSEAVQEEATVANVVVNPAFEKDFFAGLNANETATEPAPPEKVEGYSHAEINEFWSSLIWGGLYRGTLGGLADTTPANDLPNAHHISIQQNSLFAQMYLEFEDSLIVFEAPPHQTDLVIEYIQETLGKKITHLWLTHHHHDHAYDAAKFVKLGAKIIVPEISTDYWESIPGADLITYSEGKPYIHSDSKMQARFLWRPGQSHAVDLSYAVVTSSCPTENSTILAYEADSWQSELGTDFNVAFKWLEHAALDGLGRNATIVPVHGVPSPFERVLEEIGFPYPDLGTLDFKSGGDLCLTK